jgi:DNA-binding beta-propeller fold protein YncE
MLSEGRLLVVNPETLGMTLQTDVASLAVDTSNVYDVATGLAFSGVIDTALATYEDLALYRSGERLDVFIAGYYNAWQFVMRVRFQGSAVQSAQGIVTSGASLAPYDNGPHGVAVNRQGTVLTTLGYAPPNSEEGTVDRAVAFGVGYPEDPGQAPQYVLDDQQTFGSRGMGSDALGNFYVASGLAGGGLACSGASCLMVVPPGLDGVACYPLEAVTANPLDVASSPAGDAVYVMDADTDIFSENDVIWAFRFQRVYLPLVLGETL